MPSDRGKRPRDDQGINACPSKIDLPLHLPSDSIKIPRCPFVPPSNFTGDSTSRIGNVSSSLGRRQPWNRRKWRCLLFVDAGARENRFHRCITLPVSRYSIKVDHPIDKGIRTRALEISFLPINSDTSMGQGGRKRKKECEVKHTRSILEKRGCSHGSFISVTFRHNQMCSLRGGHRHKNSNLASHHPPAPTNRKNIVG